MKRASVLLLLAWLLGPLAVARAEPPLAESVAAEVERALDADGEPAVAEGLHRASVRAHGSADPLMAALRARADDPAITAPRRTTARRLLGTVERREGLGAAALETFQVLASAGD
ncbi:MAG: hypothetical protein O2894_13310, partial [Planctomycetota bacterium]|nr:hypothetical protein [Planctomycetota bacterium]